MANYAYSNGVLLPAFSDGLVKKPELSEIATSNDGRDITRGYIHDNMLLHPMDSVLQQRGLESYQVYEEIARDDQVKTCRQQRELALIGKEWSVEPGDSSRKAKVAADRLEAVLKAINWDDKTQKMLSAVLYGFAAAEVMWATDGAEITIEAIKVRNRSRFGFLPNGELRMRTSRNQVLGEALPPGKFWTFACGADHDDEPYGLGLGHYLYWPVFFKKNGMRAWLLFLDKFAQPTALGKYPVNATTDEKKKLLQALAAIQSDSAIRIPEGMQVELLEAARSGTADYTALVDRMNAAISKVYLGHSAAADETPGKLGGSADASNVREDLIKADADLVCGSFNLSVAKWLTYYNDGDTVPPPKVWRKTEPPEDLKARADRDKVIFDMGYKPTLKYIKNVYDEEFEPVQVPSASGNVPGNPADLGNAQPVAADKKAVQFAEANVVKVDLIESMTNQLDAAAQPAIDTMLQTIKDMLNHADSIPDAMNKMDTLFPDLDKSDLANMLSQAILAANLSGQDSINNATSAGSDYGGR